MAEMEVIMRKISKGFALFYAVVIIIISAVPAKAESYYTNSQGVELSQAEYDKLTSAFDAEIVGLMKEETIKQALEDDLEPKIAVSVYQIVFEKIDADGNVDTVTNTISKKMADKMLASSGDEAMPHVSTPSAEYNTAMKKITMYYTNAGYNTTWFTIKNEWKKLPTIRSYDVIAVRPSRDCIIANEDIGKAAFEAHQVHDGTDISYSWNGEHVNYRSGLGNGQGGVGVSMNLSNTAQSSLSNLLTVRFTNYNSDILSVFGTYQHAVENVTLKQSTDYVFHGRGLGAVVKYNSDSIANKYDNTEGLHVTWDAAY